MAKTKSVFTCQNCAATHPKWAGQCSNCGQWNTLVETVVSTAKSNSKNQKSKLVGPAPISLGQVKIKKGTAGRVLSKIGELDRVLGGGIVPGSVILVGGEPGIGKSTLLTQLALEIANSKHETTNTKQITKNNKQTSKQIISNLDIRNSNLNHQVLYVCGEESPEQVKMRADRLTHNSKPTTHNVLLLPETNVDSIIAIIESTPGLSLVIVDSIQSMYTEDLSGMAGSVGQVRESAQRLLNIGKRLSLPIFLVGHVTKSGTLAGPKVLEHLVDTVLELTGERTGAFRILRAVKNRFGATDEVGVFAMSDLGMIEVTNPSEAFLEERQTGVPGSVTVAVMEGTRPILVEIQALVVTSQLAVPRRVVNGLSVNKVQLLSAVLQKRCGLSGLGNSDIFVNIAGGISVREPAADLGIALAIASSLKNQPVPDKLVAIGEVGLLGELRRVSFLEKRQNEAKKLGYSQIIAPGSYSTLRQVARKLFN